MEAKRLAGELDIFSKTWDTLLNRWQEVKKLWDEEVQALIDKRFTNSQENQEQQAQKQKDYEMKLKLWKQNIEEHERCRQAWLLKLASIKCELEKSFELGRPSAPPFPEDVVNDFNALVHMIYCMKFGDRVAYHSQYECPHRLQVPKHQQTQKGDALPCAKRLFNHEPAIYTKMKNDIDELFYKSTSSKPKPAPSPPYILYISSPEDCMRTDMRAFDISVQDELGMQDLHPAEVALVKTKRTLHAHKQMWMDCIRHVKDGTDLTSKDKEILGTHDAFCFFLPKHLERIAPEQNNIYGERIGKIMTKRMVDLVKKMHAELMRFELDNKNARQSLTQVHKCFSNESS